jgi:hypothetical protein
LQALAATSCGDNINAAASPIGERDSPWYRPAAGGGGGGASRQSWGEGGAEGDRAGGAGLLVGEEPFRSIYGGGGGRSIRDAMALLRGLNAPGRPEVGVWEARLRQGRDILDECLAQVCVCLCAAQRVRACCLHLCLFSSMHACTTRSRLTTLPLLNIRRPG